MKLTEEEKDRYLDWFFQECYAQADELSWLIDNLNEEGLQSIKHTVTELNNLEFYNVKNNTSTT